MTTTTRQNNLILAEDWTRIYQTFKNADFKSYDFENLRRVMINYLRENYPEDFNDYIESSEYLALIDLIAFLGQSLAFRIDLSSRENFIELASRKESVLRLAKSLAYNAKRNIPASGLLKFDTISTTENLLDSAGRNLARQVIQWNDPTNSNWFEQFITVINAAQVPSVEFGKSQASGIIGGITSDQYRFNSLNSDVPIFSFTKPVASRNMTFEIVSTAVGNETIFEENPFPGNQYSFVYRQDGKGNSSPNTGFFMLFKQGTLEQADFVFDQPSANERVGVETPGINDSDIWLYSLDNAGLEQEIWTSVSSLVGNNIAYNSIRNNIRNIYSVTTREEDKIDLNFADGVFGNLPQGRFRIYYRVSNGLRYSISPADMSGITIALPYLNSQGVEHTLTISMSLNYTVDNSSPSEDIASIRERAPAQYYIQNRMITGEDYNLAPLTSSQELLKVKAVNRISSGISRNFDIIDVTGRYSDINVIADDGLVYRTNIENSLRFTYTNRNTAINFIRNSFDSVLSTFQTYNFFLTNYDKIFPDDSNATWVQTTTDSVSTTGYFVNNTTFVKVGKSYTRSNFQYVEQGAMVKFQPLDSTKAYRGSEIVDYDPLDPTQRKYIWAKVISVIGDGTNADRGNLSTGFGPITLSGNIPSQSKPVRFISKFSKNISSDIESAMLDLMFSSKTFGLRFDLVTRSWRIITENNLNLIGNFSLGQAGDNTNNNLDASWIAAFIFDGDEYLIRIRGTDYIFGSVKQNSFYFDSYEDIYDSRTRQVIKDKISVLGINPSPGQNLKTAPEIAKEIVRLREQGANFSYSEILALIERTQTLSQDIPFEVVDSVRYDDGASSNKFVKVQFFDSDNDGIIDNPEAFDEVVGLENETRFLFFREFIDEYGTKNLVFIPNDNGTVVIRESEINTNINDFEHNQLIYFYSSNEDVVKRVDLVTRSFIIEPSYVAFVGRSGLKFQYNHNANSDRRIDPSSSNIVDIYVLTRQYDNNYRAWIRDPALTEPTPLTSEEIRVQFGGKLNEIKSISDEIVFHPVKYFSIFGSRSRLEFRATIKVVKNPSRTINDNDLKGRIISSINEFFLIQNWDFGDTFYASELITFVIAKNSPDISNMVIVPVQPDQAFGSLLEIKSQPNEIFISSATVDDVQIVSNITAAELNLNPSTIVNSTSR